MFRCWSYLGMIGQRGQKVSIGYGCEDKGVVMHEMLHALGFDHEQNRNDRDKAIRIQWNNIMPGKRLSYPNSFRDCIRYCMLCIYPHIPTS